MDPIPPVGAFGREAASAFAGKLASECRTSGASSNVCAVDEFGELTVSGVGVAPADVAADHSGLFSVAGVIGAVESEVAQGLELGFDPVQPLTRRTGCRRVRRCSPLPTR